MDAIRGYALSLAMLTLLSGIAEMLVPGGSTKKYVRVALGMIIISMILDPVLQVVAGVRSVKTPALSGHGMSISATARVDSASPLTQRRDYESRAKWQVESMAASVQGVLSARAQVELSPVDSRVPSIERITLEVRLTPEARGRAGPIEEALKALLSAYLSIGRDRVTVRTIV